MPKTKKQLKFFSFYDFPAMEKHLSDMAAEGWMIKSAEGSLWKYEQIEPKRLHFAVTYFPKASALDPEPSDELKMLWDFCEHTGWKLAVQAAQIQIFYNESENPRPIETDPVAQIENIHRAAKKTILSNLWIGLILGFMNLGLFLYQFFSRPVDTLANASRLWSCAMWLLYLLAVSAEPIAYFSWYKKARRIALEEDRLAFPQDTRLMKNLLFLLIMVVLVYMILSLPGAGALQGVIFGILYITGIYIIVNTIMKYLRRRRVSAKANFSITMIVSFVLSFAMVGILTLAILKSTQIGWITSPDAAGTYTHDGMVWEYYEDELPLTAEDLTGEIYDGYSYQLSTDSTVFLNQTECRQRPRFDAPDYKIMHHLEYTITEVKIPFLYELCKEDLIYRLDNTKEDHIPEGHKDIYEPMDPTPWGAKEVYQLTSQDSGPTGYWLVCYDSCFIELSLLTTISSVPNSAQVCAGESR